MFPFLACQPHGRQQRECSVAAAFQIEAASQKSDLLPGSETAPRTQPSRFGPPQSIALGAVQDSLMVGGTKPRFRKHVEKEREDARAWC